MRRILINAEVMCFHSYKERYNANHLLKSKLIYHDNPDN